MPIPGTLFEVKLLAGPPGERVPGGGGSPSRRRDSSAVDANTLRGVRGLCMPGFPAPSPGFTIRCWSCPRYDGRGERIATTKVSLLLAWLLFNIRARVRSCSSGWVCVCRSGWLLGSYTDTRGCLLTHACAPSLTLPELLGPTTSYTPHAGLQEG